MAAPTLLDRFLPDFDAVERHACTVRATPERVYDALWKADLGRSPAACLLLRARGFPGGRPFTLEGFREAGFVLLDARPPRELALGIAGRFWSPSGGLAERGPYTSEAPSLSKTAPPRRRLDPAAFRAFEEPGSAKAVWGFSLEPLGPERTRLCTETRVRCYGRGARRRFRLYWLGIRPFSGFLRRRMLALVRREAESGPES